MTAFPLTLGCEPLSLATLDACLGRPLRVAVCAEAQRRVVRGREWVAQLVRRDEPVYGINTGFGHLKNKRISTDQLDRLQENLIVSHAVGVGPPAPPEIVRWMMLFKLHMLLDGHSGVRAEVVELLRGCLSADLLPVVPTRGSLGASGDLAPLAHVVLALIGRSEMSVSPSGSADAEREARPAAEALAAAGLKPLRLAAKEGLALINGTQFMSAYAANIAVRAGRLADLADLIAAVTLEGMAGSVRPLDERLHRLRPHPGALTVAANLRHHLADSEIVASHQHCDRVQDPYSLRCVPQVHGAFRDALTHFCDVITREVNSVTDNPLIFGPTDPTTERSRSTASQPLEAAVEAISGGNFHGQPLALVLDYLALALTNLANISERRIYLLLSGAGGLPALLMKDTGLNSGFMLAQYTAAALLNECKVLSSPASVDSIPTSLGQEDHVSMGATAAVKCYEILDRVETVLATELMCAVQALDFRAPLKPGVGPRAVHALVRRHIPHAAADRLFGVDIATALSLLRGSAELRCTGAPRGEV